MPDAGCTRSSAGRSRPARTTPTPAAGRKPASTEEFAEQYGYKKWTTDLDEALADPEVDIVIIAGPSETHAEMALEVARARQAHAGRDPDRDEPGAVPRRSSRRPKERGRDPRRGAPDAVPHRAATRSSSGSARARSGSPTSRAGSSSTGCTNVGATGLQRSWTDNLLWHHTTHLVDFGLWMVSGGDMATAERADPERLQRLPADRAAHRHPDGTGGGDRDPRRPDRSSDHRLVLLRRVHLRHARA